MEELEYVKYVRDRSDTRMLLNPLRAWPLLKDKYPVEMMLELGLEFDGRLLYDDLEETPAAIDIDHLGDLSFLYVGDRYILDDILSVYPELVMTSIVTSDPREPYLRPGDMNSLIELRDDYYRL